MPSTCHRGDLRTVLGYHVLLTEPGGVRHPPCLPLSGVILALEPFHCFSFAEMPVDPGQL